MSESMVMQLKVSLLGSEPTIWRRLEIVEDATLAELHDALQACMGWENAHLHQFRVGKKTFGPILDDDDFDSGTADELELTVSEALQKKGSKLFYDYDFGDDWEHEVALEARLPIQPDVNYPRCTGGERAAPPEDCGGVPGYESILTALQDPEHPEHADVLEWLGDENFDPEHFDLSEVNERLALQVDDEDDLYYDDPSDAVMAFVEAQVEENSPPEARAALQRMAAKSIEESVAWELLAAAYTYELYNSFAQQREFDDAAYMDLLEALPKLPG